MRRGCLRFGGQGVGGGEVVAVEVDGDFLEGFEGADDAFDADPGGVLEVAGDGQGGHDHGQVGLDGVMGVVEDRSGPQVVLAHPEGLLDVPQLVIRRDDLTGAHQAGRDVGDVALEADQGPWPGRPHPRWRHQRGRWQNEFPQRASRRR